MSELAAAVPAKMTSETARAFDCSRIAIAAVEGGTASGLSVFDTGSDTLTLRYDRRVYAHDTVEKRTAQGRVIV
jgi:hypothetical protein